MEKVTAFLNLEYDELNLTQSNRSSEKDYLSGLSQWMQGLQVLKSMVPRQVRIKIRTNPYLQKIFIQSADSRKNILDEKLISELQSVFRDDIYDLEKNMVLNLFTRNG
jgi:hypothetical protein